MGAEVAPGQLNCKVQVDSKIEVANGCFQKVTTFEKVKQKKHLKHESFQPEAARQDPNAAPFTGSNYLPTAIRPSDRNPAK